MQDPVRGARSDTQSVCVHLCVWCVRAGVPVQCRCVPCLACVPVGVWCACLRVWCARCGVHACACGVRGVVCMPVWNVRLCGACVHVSACGVCPCVLVVSARVAHRGWGESLASDFHPAGKEGAWPPRAGGLQLAGPQDLYSATLLRTASFSCRAAMARRRCSFSCSISRSERVLMWFSST